MLYRLRRRANYAIFNATCGAIELTTPIAPTADGPIVLSMVNRRDYIPYLIAAKSLFRRLHRGRFHVIDDGTMTAAQRSGIRHHLRAEIESIKAVTLGPTPRGGTWERLTRIADLVTDSYVIQMDCDTLTVGDIDEVREAIDDDASFTLITHPNTHYCSITEACAVARADPATDIHTVAEQILDRLGSPQTSRYVHGCSGFAGFAKGSFDRSEIYRISRIMEEALGNRWSEWGSEQVTSNYIVSNASRIATLPYPKYRNYDAEPIGPDTSFIHFIGTHRFRHGYYRRRARREVAAIP